MKTAVWYTSTFVVIFLYLYVYLVQFIRGAEMESTNDKYQWPPVHSSSPVKGQVRHQAPLPAIPPVLNFTYHNYEEMTAWLKQFTAAHSSRAALYSIGKSVQGRELWVVVLSSSAHDYQVGKPNIRVVANIHGNEAVSREVALQLIQELGSNYTRDSYIGWLLDNSRIHIMPSLNPDGFEVAREGVCTGDQGRYNAGGFDLNRNFQDYFKQNTRKEQPEIRAYRQWITETQFVLAAGLHGGALVASYPFDSAPTPVEFQSSERRPSLTPDDDVFQHVAYTYSSIHETMHLGLPCEGSNTRFANGTTNGAAWYPLTGGAQDYSYVWRGTLEITVEMSCCKYPPAAELPTHWQQHRPALLKFLGEAHRGVRGFVMDINGRPLESVSMKIKGRDAGFHTTKHGEFWRILLPGLYTVEAYKEGYVPAEQEFSVMRQFATVVNMTLIKVQPDPVGHTKGTPSKLPASSAKEDSLGASGFRGFIETVRSQLDGMLGFLTSKISGK